MIHIFKKSLEIASSTGKLFSHPLKTIFERHYKEKRFARTLFVLDIVVLLAIVVSTALILAFTVFAPPKIVDQVRVDATVAPSDVVSGDSSTLVFHYENTSNEELRFTKLHLDFPAHFDLQAAPEGLTEVSPQTYDLGTIAAGASGSIKLRGVMFGDVGGKQVVQSTLSFTYGSRNKPASKFSEYTFSPSHSTLSLHLLMPDHLVAGQEVNGQISYENTGTVDFPQIQITPTWPDTFELVSSDPVLQSGQFILQGLKAGEKGTISFVGRLPSSTSANFSFQPTFTFGDDNYKQEVLNQTVELLPSQLNITTTFDATSVTPGGTLTATINYEHTGMYPISNLTIHLDSSSPFFKNKSIAAAVIPLVNPGDKGSVTLKLPVYTSVDPKKLTSFSHLSAALSTITDYTLTDDVASNVSVTSDRQTLPITSPVVLESFGRYTSPQGDQLGRGPLPPTVDEETKYWVFMTIRGTTDELENVKMDANLGPGVTLTGKQSISYGESLNEDAASKSIEWTIGSLPPTLAAGSQVVSVAFEVAITPSADMIGKTPTLLASPLVTARDTITGAFVTAHGGAITTNMPYDQMAAGLGVVEN